MTSEITSGFSITASCVVAEPIVELKHSETLNEIVSIDIFEMNLGKNIFAEQKLQEADLEKKAMQTRLEARRLEAVALEQENKAKVEEALSRIANF